MRTKKVPPEINRYVNFWSLHPEYLLKSKPTLFSFMSIKLKITIPPPTKTWSFYLWSISQSYLSPQNFDPLLIDLLWKHVNIFQSLKNLLLSLHHPSLVSSMSLFSSSKFNLWKDISIFKFSSSLSHLQHPTAVLLLLKRPKSRSLCC